MLHAVLNPECTHILGFLSLPTFLHSPQCSKNQFDVVSPIDGCLFSIVGAFEEYSFQVFIWNDTEISCDDMAMRCIPEW